MLGIINIVWCRQFMGIFIGELCMWLCNVAWEDIKMYVTTVRSNTISIQDINLKIACVVSRESSLWPKCQPILINLSTQRWKVCAGMYSFTGIRIWTLTPSCITTNKKTRYCKNRIHLFSFVNITKMTQYLQSLVCEQSRIQILVVKLVPFLSHLNISA